ncbi:hypothetical protein [Actinotalea sp. K2]|uniref:hypothetical protein n=1 Tax=Actinotalea sp. K2 TaxID=2939438 RepID=UPI0020177568|nr:hypothetical protein [Actinotalea sp. K2]MCL3862519.1 hypothetical protein [Actinotalea sp. K2]
MDDDAIRDRLRRLGEVEPPVSVDRAGVLRAGRRRRLARRVGTTGLVLALAAGAYPAVAALTPDRAPAPPAAPTPAETVAPPPRAIVDRAAGTITLPIDQTGLTPDDWDVSTTMYRHFVSACMEDGGFDDLWWLEGPAVEPPPWVNLPYGVWRTSDVRENGYGVLVERLVQSESPRELDDAEFDALMACESALVDAGLAVDESDLVEEHGALGGFTPAEGTSEGRSIREEWRQCLADAGVEPPPQDADWLPEGVRDAPFEEQVRIGLIDVACKERLDIIQRMGDRDAAQQAAYLEKTAEYRSALRSAEAATLDRAREYLEEHGISIP